MSCPKSMVGFVTMAEFVTMTDMLISSLNHSFEIQTGLTGIGHQSGFLNIKNWNSLFCSKPFKPWSNRLVCRTGHGFSGFLPPHNFAKNLRLSSRLSTTSLDFTI